MNAFLFSPGLRPTFSLRRARPAVAIVALVLAACGGGGDDAPASQTRSERASAVDSTPATSIPLYTVTNLSLGGNGGWVERKGINASGQVAGYANVPSGVQHAFFFDGSTMLDLGTLGGDYSRAAALNDSGQVTGVANTTGNAFSHVFFWKPGGSLTDVSPGAYNAEEPAISSAGLVVGHESNGYFGFAWSEGGGFQSWVCCGSNYFSPRGVNTSGQMSGFGTDAVAGITGSAVRSVAGTVTAIVGTSNQAPFLINDDGLVGGWKWGGNAGLVHRAFAYRAGTLDVFGEALAASPYDFNEPSDLNQIGQMVGLATRTTLTGQVIGIDGFVRTPISLISAIGNLGGGGPYPITIPNAINNHGQVVGYSSGDAIGNPRAFTWTPVTGMVNLNSKLTNPPPGLILSSALAISDNGSIVSDSNLGLVLLKPVVTGPPPTAAALGPIDANDPVAVGSTVGASVAFTDVNTSDTHTAQWTWGDASAATVGSVSEANGAGSASGSHVFAAAGVYQVSVVVTDSSGRAATIGREIVVYDPLAGSVTGRGSISSPIGAYRPMPTLAGPATFAFVSKYKKGTTVPSGKTQFQFAAAQMNFRSNTYDWLVVSGARAQYKGIGTLNGQPGFKFLLTAVDGALLARGTPDRFRIKIWHFDAGTNADVTDYDNQIDGSLTGGNSEGTVIDGGHIAIRK